jgi:hypothetical protein
LSDVRYLVELVFDEDNDDLGVLGGIADDVFGGASTPDSDESDPGPRLVRALRACIEAQAGGSSSKGPS